MPNPVNQAGGSSLFPPGVVGPGTTTSPQMVNTAWRGMKLVIDITAIVTGTLTVTIRGRDPVSGKQWTVLASAALAAAATTILTVYPGLVVAANLVANDVLPPLFDITMVVGGTSATATVNPHFLV